MGLDSAAWDKHTRVPKAAGVDGLRWTVSIGSSRSVEVATEASPLL